jgi:transposase
VRKRSVWARACGLTSTVVEGVEVDEAGSVIIVSVRPNAKARDRCGRCSRRSPRYDRGEGRRRWRALDAGTAKVFVEADAPRVSCRDHGVVVAAVPWARHGAGHTRDFDAMAAWLSVRTSKTAVTLLLRVAWRTVGSILTRVAADIDATVDRLDGLRRIGIDEISYKRGHRYLVVVIDHDTGHLVWARPGRDTATVLGFFDDLGPERTAALTHISADGADWIAAAVAERAPGAVLCADPFHVVAWAMEALDVERRRAWNQASGRRPVGLHQHRSQGDARRIRRARYALWKNPDTLTAHQRHQLDWIAKTDPRLHRAYLLKEGLRYVFAVKGPDGKVALDQWISWARRSQIPSFVELSKRIRRHRVTIDAALDHGLSNARTESTNTKIRLLTRVAFGFHGPEPLIALAMLALGHHPPRLPGR